MCVSIPHKHCVITWGLNITKPGTNVIKPQLWYYNTVTKQRKNSKTIPDEGLNLMHNGDSVYTEVRFLVDQEDFDCVILQLSDSKLEGDYLVSIEKVEQLGA